MILKPLGHEQVTGLNTVKSLTVPSGAQRALLVCTAQNVRWRDDGTNPAADTGIQLTTGTPFWYEGDLSAIKFIEEAASSVLEVSYYG
jgi:hypothetical protein